jgi:hypothetical protein
MSVPLVNADLEGICETLAYFTNDHPIGTAAHAYQEDVGRLVAEVRRLRTVGQGMVAESSWDELADEMTEVEAEVKRLRTDLATCYRLTGADPDVDEDWRLAGYAVAQVQRLREEADQADEDNDRLRDGIKTAKLVADGFGVEFTQWRKDGVNGSTRGLAIPEDCDFCEVTIDADVYEAMADLWGLLGDDV